MNVTEYFYDYVLQSLSNNENDELYVIIKRDGQQSGFFELCKAFLDIPLNSEKFKDENGRVTGCFKFDDIDKAKIATKRFVETYDLHDISKLFVTIHDCYKKAKDFDDERVSSGMIRNEDLNSSIGIYGTYYDFTAIPVWDDIVKDITHFINSK